MLLDKSTLTQLPVLVHSCQYGILFLLHYLVCKHKNKEEKGFGPLIVRMCGLNEFTLFTPIFFCTTLCFMYIADCVHSRKEAQSMLLWPHQTNAGQKSQLCSVCTK